MRDYDNPVKMTGMEEDCRGCRKRISETSVISWLPATGPFQEEAHGECGTASE
jgi:hypothetical protein